MFRKVSVWGGGSGSVAAVTSATAASLVSREDSTASGADSGDLQLAPIATGDFRCRMDILWYRLLYGGVAARLVLLIEETSNIYLPLLTTYFFWSSDLPMILLHWSPLLNKTLLAFYRNSLYQDCMINCRKEIDD